MCISSPPHSGLQFDLLVRSVPHTTSELLCKLHVGDVVEIGPVKGTGFAIQNINPPRTRRPCSCSPLQRDQERFKWEETGVKVVPLTLKKENIQEPFLEHTLNGIIGNPLSTGAVIVGPLILKEVITGVLLDHGVPQEKILTIEWNPDIDLSTLDSFGLNGLGLIRRHL
ncbi:hypothetical protein ZWY2020_011463 [Hordeum vulgare]|nr:hypothetical protein ZWY2020_011463 [Hordeum vulgare]